jgi:hypothetical protein
MTGQHWIQLREFSGEKQHVIRVQDRVPNPQSFPAVVTTCFRSTNDVSQMNGA